MKKNNTIHNNADCIKRGDAILGIELGSTRIKASLINSKSDPLASGSYDWENQYVDGIWTYDVDDIWAGVAGCYADLVKNVKEEYDVTIRKVASIGFSGMMHGYIVLNKEGELLTPFRTWRNNSTHEACEKLTPAFDFAVPQRWSIAHLYQAILNGEEHVIEIDYLSTLAGYVHWKLTGNRVVGIGEGSGMFPIDSDTLDYDAQMVEKFDQIVSSHGVPWKLMDIMPKVLVAGTGGGELTREGAALLDPTGTLESGIPLCPPEGDAGTGMVATNSVRERTGNVSAGTSVFAMIVLEKKLSKAHDGIDIVTTPDGKQVGMAHSNNCSSDFNAWMNIFDEVVTTLGFSVSPDELYGKLLPLVLQSDTDASGIMSIGYVSGEHITGFSEGRPFVVRKPDSNFTLGNLLRSLLFSAFSALRTGLNIMMIEEGVHVDEIRGHGGIFKTPLVAQRIIAAATNTPISLSETAGEGGAWGMAILAGYMMHKKAEQTLPDYLDQLISESIGVAVKPDPEDVAGFNRFFTQYHEVLEMERVAVKVLQ